MTTSLLSQLREIGCTVLQNELMSEYTSFRIGGPADIVVPKNIDQLVETITLFKRECSSYFVLGRGSNLIVSDAGIDEPVIWISGAMSDVKMHGDSIIIAQSGARLSYVSEFAAKNSLTGLEFAYGIPGSIGGAVFMNAGAYGGEMAGIVKQATVIDENGRLLVLSNEELDFSYRHSSIKNGMIVVNVELQLQSEEEKTIRYRMQELQKKRIEKQPLQFPSAGSVFKRPVGYYAGKLIEDAGLKGYQIGGAAVSEKHAGFIINKGNATCDDVLKLICHVQKTVKQKSGVFLECEVRRIGRGV